MGFCAALFNVMFEDAGGTDELLEAVRALDCRVAGVTLEELGSWYGGERPPWHVRALLLRESLRRCGLDDRAFLNDIWELAGQMEQRLATAAMMDASDLEELRNGEPDPEQALALVRMYPDAASERLLRWTRNVDAWALCKSGLALPEARAEVEWPNHVDDYLNARDCKPGLALTEAQAGVEGTAVPGVADMPQPPEDFQVPLLLAESCVRAMMAFLDEEGVRLESVAPYCDVTVSALHKWRVEGASGHQAQKLVGITLEVCFPGMFRDGEALDWYRQAVSDMLSDLLRKHGTNNAIAEITGLPSTSIGYWTRRRRLCECQRALCLLQLWSTTERESERAWLLYIWAWRVFSGVGEEETKARVEEQVVEALGGYVEALGNALRHGVGVVDCEGQPLSVAQEMRHLQAFSRNCVVRLVGFGPTSGEQLADTVVLTGHRDADEAYDHVEGLVRSGALPFTDQTLVLEALNRPGHPRRLCD